MRADIPIFCPTRTTNFFGVAEQVALHKHIVGTGKITSIEFIETVGRMAPIEPDLDLPLVGIEIRVLDYCNLTFS